MSGAGARHWENDKESTCYIGNLDERITDALVWELCIQAGPVVSVHLPKDRVTQAVQGYGFVEFRSEQDAEYACNILNGIRMYGKPIRVNKSNADKRGGENGGPGATQGVGAELFIGNLDQMVDEKVLYDTFSRFGLFASAPKIARDDKFVSKGYGFISYTDFDGADAAIEHMHGQYLMNKEVTVQFAYKKDGKGERHGDAAERAIAASAKKHGMGVAPAVLPANLIAPTPSAPPVQAPYGNGYPPAGGYNNYGRPPPMQNPGPPQGGYGGYPAYAPPPVAYQQQMPVPVAAGYTNGAAAPPVRHYNQTPLQAPPTAAGLPPRPPPSMGGYGGPQQPSFPGAPGGPPPGLPPGMPPGYGLPPGGAAPGQGR
jgi:splicing factor 3B subunit 4